MACADGKTRHAGAGWLSWFIPEGAGEVSITCIHGGGGQSSDFITTPDGRPGWLHDFLRAGFAVYLLDRPGHGRAGWNHEHLGPALPAADYEMMTARFMHPARAAPWPEAASHSQWPEGADDAFMAGQGEMAEQLSRAQAHAEAIAPALFARIGPTVLLSHSAGGPCGFAMASHAAEGQIRAIYAIEPQGAPGMVHPLGTFHAGLTVDPPKGAGDPYAAPVTVVTAEASWMRGSNAEAAAFLRRRGNRGRHLLLEAHEIYGNGHMMMLERNSDSISAFLIDQIRADLRL
ncbi:hypothetical protein EG244_18570 [Falsigemmobacter faecalis]|uniref:Alpha/beta fold hydrolase n=1 Tax=Falsigemmobacter faecalis TaxID=2488730 RepID=A0A3P3D7C2_9RHOB|nr:hypothetical protein EG244_18570 [Falsigemmobacter faecalis]